MYFFSKCVCVSKINPVTSLWVINCLSVTSLSVINCLPVTSLWVINFLPETSVWVINCLPVTSLWSPKWKKARFVHYNRTEVASSTPRWIKAHLWWRCISQMNCTVPTPVNNSTLVMMYFASELYRPHSGEWKHTCDDGVFRTSTVNNVTKSRTNAYKK